MVLEILRELNDGFSNEIPEQILEGHGKFKVRRNWWQRVVFGLQILEMENQVPSEFRKELDQFIKDYTSNAFREQPLTTREDIGRANLLNRVLDRDKPI